MKKILLFSLAAVILFSVPLSSLLSDFREISSQINLSVGRTATRPVNPVQLASAQNYSGLPVGEVVLHRAEQAWGTAILIPQNHRYPGSEVDDPKNDSAELTQKQIYNIISFLQDQYGVNLIMAEGDLYGEVPREKIVALAEKIKSRDQLIAQIEALKEQLKRENISTEIKDNFLNHAQQLIASLDREIYLQGAPYKLKAENQEVRLFGSENQSTRQQSAEIVRNYIYQQDKMRQYSAGINGGNSFAVSGGLKQWLDKFKQLKNNLLNRDQSSLSRLRSDNLEQRIKELKDQMTNLPQIPLNNILEQLKNSRQNQQLSLLIKLDNQALTATPPASQQTIKDRLAALKNQLAHHSSAPTSGLNSKLSAFLLQQTADPWPAFENDLQQLETEAQRQNRSGLVAILNQVKKLFQTIKNSKRQPAAATAAVPQRQNNPYAQINNPAELQQLIKDSEAKIQTVVIDRRNQEAAQYFSQTLKEQNSDIGILQFGAGHEDGLIKELNRQGLDVIVIKSDEVIRREKISAVEKIL